MRAPDPGLCRACRNSRLVRSARGSTFWLCELSRVDPAFPRYPPLPVVRCSGFTVAVVDRGADAQAPPVDIDPNPEAT